MSKKESKADEDFLISYFVKQNRPYSFNDIAQNLHKDLGKSSIQKILENLVQDGIVIEKSYGKQKIYFLNQSSLTEVDATPDKVKELDTQLEAEERIVKENERVLKEILTEFKNLGEYQTTDEIKGILNKLRPEVDAMKAKLNSLPATKTSDIVDRKTSKEYLARCVKEHQLRKKTCMDVINNILENCELLDRNALFGEIGIDTD